MFLGFCQSNLKCFLNPQHWNSNDNSTSDEATVMQEKECSGFVRHVIDAASILFPV